MSKLTVEPIPTQQRPEGMARSRLFLSTLLVCLLAACSAARGSAGGSQGPITEADAIRLVLAQNARFDGIGPAEADVVGQAGWYEVSDGDGGWQIRIRIGWGDCPAGCINQHTWTYRVSSAGDITLVREQGEALPETGVHGVVVAGPTCPVETIPPQSGCEGRFVEGAVLIFMDSTGAEAARATSAADGTFDVALAPGEYRAVPQPVEGLMGTAPESTFRVELGEAETELTIAYDTGIR